MNARQIMIENSICVLSGGFDPIHVGHVRMINAAKLSAVWLIIGLNSDEWLIRKKGKAFMPFEERREILLAINGVTDVIGFDDEDGTANDLLRRVADMRSIFNGFCHVNINMGKEIYFGNGGDRTKENIPELELCQELNIKMLWGLGGDKIQSSSTLLENVNGES
jgi:D-beta-D-heptose 7-phosphate kinase/D-beta-D-heptose 1-phosphate adenosyltransferase